MFIRLCMYSSFPIFLAFSSPGIHRFRLICRHMAASEMRSITADKWADEVWGMGQSSSEEEDVWTKLYFYFGRDDHWVAERTRDEIIELRGQAKGCRMMVCEEGVPHAFCLSEYLSILRGWVC